jgi:hypothetical protein
MVVTFVIGVHQTITYGIGAAYFIVMISISLMFWLRLRRINQKKRDHRPTKKKQKR